jgi:hypothetical protein
MKKDQSKEKSSEIEIDSPKKKQKKHSKKTLLKWVGGVFVLVVLFLGLQYFSFIKKAEASREAQAQQEQILISHWEEQGLSQEEIQTKLRETRIESFDPDDAPLIFQLMRSFRHATGTGPGNGVPGSGSGDGSGMGAGMGSGSVKGARSFH